MKYEEFIDTVSNCQLSKKYFFLGIRQIINWLFGCLMILNNDLENWQMNGCNLPVKLDSIYQDVATPGEEPKTFRM
jgi:hypothetical protein